MAFRTKNFPQGQYPQPSINLLMLFHYATLIPTSTIPTFALPPPASSQPLTNQGESIHLVPLTNAYYNAPLNCPFSPYPDTTWCEPANTPHPLAPISLLRSGGRPAGHGLQPCWPDLYGHPCQNCSQGPRVPGLRPTHTIEWRPPLALINVYSLFLPFFLSTCVHVCGCVFFFTNKMCD